jgi:hypothetical protein
MALLIVAILSFNLSIGLCGNVGCERVVCGKVDGFEGGCEKVGCEKVVCERVDCGGAECERLDEILFCFAKYKSKVVPVPGYDELKFVLSGVYIFDCNDDCIVIGNDIDDDNDDSMGMNAVGINGFEIGDGGVDVIGGINLSVIFLGVCKFIGEFIGEFIGKFIKFGDVDN